MRKRIWLPILILAIIDIYWYESIPKVFESETEVLFISSKSETLCTVRKLYLYYPQQRNSSFEITLQLSCCQSEYEFNVKLKCSPPK